MADNQDKSSTTGFCYSTHDPNNMQTHLLNQIQSFHESAPPDQNQIFNHHQSFFNKHDSHHSIMDAAAPDYDLMRCVFSCEGNERPSQGLSLSLSSSNPSTIGLQSFELRNPQNQHDFRDGFYGKSINMVQNQGQFHLRNSKFLGPAQELLNEFCFLGNKENDNHTPIVRKQRENHEHGSSSNSTSKNTLELIELQKRKANLLAMLEEVDRRYKHYCDQMKGVVSSFEAMAGNGAAKVYSTLASKAMSRHFRCLRDGIVTQIEETKKAMGENDNNPIAPGTTKGETPRLRLLDQTLRQQKSLQQMNLMETHPWRPQRGLPERSVSVLRAWLFEHFLHPYPSDVDKHILARQTGLSRSQVSNWFINARVRLWKPMVEEMYLEETKDSLENTNTIASSSDLQAQNPNFSRTEDRKPTPNDLIRIDSDCLSSIISPNNDPKHDNQMNFGSYGTMELDHFSSYNHHHHNAATYNGGNNESGPHNFIGGSGVSLTLGLQQHGESSMGLGFSSPPQNSLFYSRDDQIIGDCDQAAQYNSILDGDQGRNLPYRNLLGAQLLHDLGS